MHLTTNCLTRKYWETIIPAPLVFSTNGATGEEATVWNQFVENQFVDSRVQKSGAQFVDFFSTDWTWFIFELVPVCRLPV